MSLFSKNDYAGALGALLPTGRAWPRSQKTVQAAVLRALSSAFQRSDNDATKPDYWCFSPYSDGNVVRMGKLSGVTR
ncbi:Prophage tail protein [Citrobacter portucalensis]|nr:Prophage tail protein [Citrobacter portucalensis]